MRLALGQWRPVTEGSAEGLSRLDRAAAEAAAAGADLLVLPEMALTGYNIGAAAVRDAAEPDGGPIAVAVAATARRHGIALVAGFPRSADGRVYNTVQLFDRSGAARARCAKTHLFGAVDRGQFSPGPEIAAPVRLDGWIFGLAICYDIEFPEVARALALAGAEAILAPTANMLPFDTVATRLVPARAEENGVYLAYANYVGAEPPFEYFGLSCVCDPTGTDVTRAGHGEELIFADLDKTVLAAARRSATHLADRRPELYGSLTKTRRRTVTELPVTMYGPDFPFAFDDWIAHPAGLGTIPNDRLGARVAIIGAGISGVLCGYELMRMGVHPVLYESGQLGGRLRSQPFEGADGVIAELGGMRFPVSSTGFYHYVDKLGLASRPFPNPLTPAAGSTVIDLAGETHYAETLADLPPLFREVAAAYDRALEDGARFSDLKSAIRSRDAARIKEIWDPIVRGWDERTFYDFVVSSAAFQALSFRHREVFGQVGFGTGGWDSDFPNSMLEILRVNVTECDENQRFILGGVEQVPQGLWRREPERMVHWPMGTTLAGLNAGAPRPGARRLFRGDDGRLAITDRWGRTESFDAVIATCQSWLMTTAIDTEERLFSQEMWMALDRTRYMQSSKTFVMVDRPFWRDRDPKTGRRVMSMTLTDRLTRGTYLFDLGEQRPGVICLTYSWMSDALKMLPLPVERRVELALSALAKIYPNLDIRAHIIGDPITVSWESDPNFLGAFKGALPGHYRYNHRMYGHFMQADLPPEQRGLFLAGDDVSWTPAWVEGAVQTALNAVWGVMTQLGGRSPVENPGPGDRWAEVGPVALPD